MATHSCILAWKISWMEEPGRLQSMGSQRVGHDWMTSLSLSLRKAFFSLLAILWNYILGSRLLEETDRTLCAPEPWGGEQWPHGRLTQTCLWMSRSLRWRHGLGVPSCRVGVTMCCSTCMGSFEGVSHYLHTSTTLWPQVNSREGTQLHTSTENWIKGLLSMALTVRKRPSFPPQ